MSFKVIKITIDNPTETLENDFKHSSIRFETISSSFLTNCVCIWEVQLGVLYLSQLMCHHEFDEHKKPKKVDFNNVQLHITYIDGFIEDENKVQINWESIEFFICKDTLAVNYTIPHSLVLNFEYGKLVKISQAYQ